MQTSRQHCFVGIRQRTLASFSCFFRNVNRVRHPFSRDVFFCFLLEFQLPIGLHSSCSISPEPVEHVKNALQNIVNEGTPHSVQSGAADHSLGFEDEDLRSSPGLLGQ